MVIIRVMSGTSPVSYLLELSLIPFENNVLKVAASIASSVIIVSPSIRVIFFLEAFLFEKLGLIVSQNFLLSVTFVMSRLE